ncbi:MAG: EAL domain-containing protein [Gammaproteobacteria bacterium]|uniref:EAL domain-containing protein n=1 Tax=Pseudacidovorax sp. TaxID=1934311 RepID=UPI001B68BD46|nr:EAL domain-containing protein [Pseudacidovorax sp.]MBP6896164.1 EAL domain-containing protein [Pseudacidovorax sp.]
MIHTIALQPAPGGSPSAASGRCKGCREGEVPLFPFSFAYQPILDLQAGEIWAHEALVRGPDGEGAMTVLDQVNADNRYRFDQACRVNAIRIAAALGIDTRLSINFLPQAVYRPEICIRTTLEAADKYSFPRDRIVFEVTEGERVSDGPWLASILTEYQRCGFLTAIDDFGAGYAGLTLLADFQPDVVKLDMALVRNVDTSRARQAITRGILRMCEELAITVVAEGVETAGERDFFLHEGVRLMQGYLFARPRFEALAPKAEIFG